MSLAAVMAVLFSLLVMSRLAQSSPLYDEMEGAGRYLESQVNTEMEDLVMTDGCSRLATPSP